MAGPNDTTEQRAPKGGSRLGLGIGVGVAIGTAIGVATDDLGLWIALGIAIGTALGLAMDGSAAAARAAKRDRRDEA